MSEPTDDPLLQALLEGCRTAPWSCAQHPGGLPSRPQVKRLLGLLLDVLYPGRNQDPAPQEAELPRLVGTWLAELRASLPAQLARALRFGADQGLGSPPPERAPELAEAFLARLPELRATLIEDARAAWEGDPAAVGLEEVVLAYPGFLAVSVHRLAHALHELGIPLIPRMMTEWAHSVTGVDLHPGARLGRGLFIDHGTGVVVGETAEVGDRVRLYQGVTLGALSHPRDAEGRVIRGAKRHPTVEDDVTIYANSAVLGGETRVGAGSLIGGAVFLTRSVPPRSKVAVKPPELSVRTSAPWIPDWEI